MVNAIEGDIKPKQPDFNNPDYQQLFKMEKENSKIEQTRKEAEKDSDPRVDLAVERTELAWERTQLAWIRTTLTFIASGIGLDKGIEAIHKDRLESGNAFVQNAHAIGVSLSTVGTLLLLITMVVYIKRTRRLAVIKGAKPILIPPGAISSMLIILLGTIISFLLLVS